MSQASSRSSWLANMPMQRKFGAVIVLLVALFILLLGANSLALQAFNHLQQQANRLVHFMEIGSGVTRAIIERQGRLIQNTFIAPTTVRARLTEADAEVAGLIKELRAATDGDSALRAAVDVVARLDQRWSQSAATPLVAAAARAERGEATPGDLNQALLAFLTAERAEGGSRAIISAIDQVNATADEALQRARTSLAHTESLLRMVDLAALVATLVAGIGALVLTAHSITRPLRTLAERMEQLADHDHDIVVPFTDRRDEVGTIARALAVFKTMAVQTYDNDWVKTGVAAVSAKVQPAEDLATFANDLLAELAPRLKAGVGVFYAFDPGSEALSLAGTYAFQERRHLSLRYALGEGLIGQSARERKPITLSPVPADYVRIHSGTGEAVPHLVVAVPVISKDRLLGVMEFACLEPLEGARARLLADVAPIAALSLDNLVRALRTRDLLEQTQRQTTELRAAEEELRTQQEELRATNEQLQSQSQKLAASEEELRVQADELQRSNAVLRHNSEELTAQKAQLEEMNREAEARADELARANQYKSQFLANMSHELRTPLNSLLILAHDLAQNHTGHLDGEEIEAANIIHSSGTNLLRLINDILDLSKVEAGKMDVVHEPVSIPAIATRMERNFRHVAQEKGVDFTVTIAPDAPPQIVTDDGKLEQITNNLLSNAFKFTAEGSVTVTFARGPGETLAVRVRDTGIGIPEDKRQTIFEAFEQVDASTRRQFGGTGLGLAITRKLAQLLGGDVTVDSSLGAGSTFQLVLPIGDGAETAAPVARPEPPSLATSLATAAPAPRPAIVVEDDRARLRAGVTTILVVEDDPAFARTLVSLVRRKGFQVLAAGDGESGLELARAHRPTGILLDVMLPGMDGWTVIERLKSDPATRHIPVHFVSALDEAKRGRDLGAVGFLTKPVSADELSGALALLAHFSPDQPRRVLVVDDDAGARLAVRKLITGEHVEVVEADSGEAALDAINSSDVDCMVLDLGLPGMSGFELLEHLAASNRQVPVVVYSGRDLTPEESMKLRAFTDSIVVKGARSPERLLDEVSLFLHSVRHDSPALPADPDGDLKGRRLLLVDDDMRNIYALAKVLRGKGIEVTLAQDGAKAVAQLESHPELEIVLMDIMMPVMDGYEATAEIRKRPQFAKLPIIALTAKAMKDDREKCLAAGASDYLAKPIDVPKLLSMIRAWLPPK
ncbi:MULTISPECIES: response regulator [unclassified Xanthobacter]|uniref:response regulator n=1 Tax=unclassified Xanthobacter TaxID=2623496 RepID=UPI001EE153C9|nr:MULTISPECIES: response regulator [unclassified Xanthobacter]